MRSVLCHLSCVLTCCVIGGCGNSSPTGTDDTITLNENPNILLVISDDLGLDASSSYSIGIEAPVTPTLDALAANGRPLKLETA